MMPLSRRTALSLILGSVTLPAMPALAGTPPVFAIGIYTLPILTAPDSPDAATLEGSAEAALYKAEFTRERAGSDILHWGEGTVSVTQTQIIHAGRMAPGPDYKLYLTSKFVEDEVGFYAIKADAALIGDVKSFEGVIVDVPVGIDVSAYSTVVVWCERFGEYITSAQYQN